MNIHFNDIKLFEQLKNATICKVIVGSHLYGLNNENSDIDYLYIYATSQNELNSFVQTNHQLQYKENGIDHNFVSLHSFIRNILNGDSTINFEVVHSEELINTDLEYLTINKNIFNTYTIIKSYLGFARRDVKHWSKGQNEYELKKRLMHIVRGFIYAEDLIANRFIFEEINLCLKSISNAIKVEKYTVDVYSKQIDNLRNKLTSMHNTNMVNPKVIDVNEGIKLNNWLNGLISTNKFYDKQQYLKDFDMTIFINALENWVSYE